MQAPPDVEMYKVPVRFCDPNDVPPGELLDYEKYQVRKVKQLLDQQKFDLFHRVTPSGYKASLLPVPSMPLVLGPVLGADPFPDSFESIFRPRFASSHSLRSLVTRFYNCRARRRFERHDTLPKLLERAALILVGTSVTLRRLPVHFHPRCRLITYSGVEHEMFRPPATKHRNQLAQLLFVGRMVPYKGLELLIRAAAIAKKRCKFELKIVGGGNLRYARFCKEIATRLGLGKSIAFLDTLPRKSLLSFYQSADLFCMPSIETYGVAILEAMSCGCAVLASDFNGPGEIVPSSVGLKVPLEHPEQFINEYAERIIQLIEDTELRNALGQRAREHVVQFHDWSQIQSQLLAIFDETFGGQTHPRQQLGVPLIAAQE